MEFSIDLLGQSTVQILPTLFLLLVGLALMLLDAFSIRGQILPLITGLGFIFSSVLAMAYAEPGSQVAFFGMLETGGIAPVVHVFLCVSGLFTLFFLQDYLKRYERPIDDVYALLVFSVIGMILFANANDLIMTFIGLETMSMCLYIFAALYKTDKRSNEAGLKYFLLGSFASAFLLFGISLLYGIGKHTNLDLLAENADLLSAHPMIFYSAVGLILIGFLFKVAAFPFHSWTPDVYEGTPTPLAGFMSTAGKLAAFVALGVFMQKLNFFGNALGEGGDPKIIQVIAIAALLTMIYGNVVAARQQNIKRMLAYSSIAHSGYILLGLCAGEAGFEAITFYMFIYTLMNIGAFGMVGMAEKNYEDTNLDSWRGLGTKAPYFAAALSVFLFSLAGIPPLAGFMAKYQVFITAIRADLILLATVGILTSVIGAYYYIRVIVLMFFGEQEKSELNTTFNWLPTTGIALLVALIFLFGVFPSLILDPLDFAFESGMGYAMALLGF